MITDSGLKLLLNSQGSDLHHITDIKCDSERLYANVYLSRAASCNHILKAAFEAYLLLAKMGSNMR